MAKITYRWIGDDPGQTGGTDGNGEAHPLLDFAKGNVTLDEDDQAYAQTIQTLLRDGVIEIAKPTRKASDA